MNICEYTHIYEYIYSTHMNTRTYMYICTYVHAYMYIHTRYVALYYFECRMRIEMVAHFDLICRK